MYFIFLVYIYSPNAFANDEWLKKESENFIVVFKSQHSNYLNDVIKIAESSLTRIGTLLDYKPPKKLYIKLVDHRDEGSGRATSLPVNRITINLSSYTVTDYEYKLVSNTLTWLVSHELVHIAVSDQATPLQELMRKLFGKVMPRRSSPLSLIYSSLANSEVYSPAWYHEGIAVFFETWLNTGKGRLFSAFDEMYFRTLEKEGLLTVARSENQWHQANIAHDQFIVGAKAYLFGSRFILHLSKKYGVEQLLAWIKVSKKSNTFSFEKKFKEAFNVTIEAEWSCFIEEESDFQRKNLSRLALSPVTLTKPLSLRNGWVSRPAISRNKEIIYASFEPGELAKLIALNVEKGTERIIADIPTPGLVRVSELSLLKETVFFTTHNNSGYRDLWSINIDGKNKKRIWKDARLSHLAVNNTSGELWGIKKTGMNFALIKLEAPFTKYQHVYTLPKNIVLTDLAFKKDGTRLLATLKSDKIEQSIVSIDVEALELQSRFLYKVISNSGNPEHPSWGTYNQDKIYWHATVNGVSNIYSHGINDDTNIQTNTLTGLYSPLEFDEKKVFAFEFNSQGFSPVTFDLNKADEKQIDKQVNAINFKAQQLVLDHPPLLQWNINNSDATSTNFDEPVSVYSGLFSMERISSIPVFGYFDNKAVFGGYFEFADPLETHSFRLGIGKSKNNFHIDANYLFEHKVLVNYQQKPMSFYNYSKESANEKLSSSLGLELKHYWRYDRPSEVSQIFYSRLNQQRTQDNSAVKQSSFHIGTKLQFKSLRKTIGYSGYEHGYKVEIDYQHIFNTNALIEFSERWSANLNYMHPIFLQHNILNCQISYGQYTGKKLDAGIFYFSDSDSGFFEEGTSRRYQLEHYLANTKLAVGAKKYKKLLIENRFPPFSISAKIGPLTFNRADLSVYAMYTDIVTFDSPSYLDSNKYWGIQMTSYFDTVYSLNSSLSIGYVSPLDSNSFKDGKLYLYAKFFQF